MHWVPDRAEAVAAYQAAGFHVVVGGEHPGWGSHNALCHFGLAYIELIGVHDPSLTRFGPDAFRESGRMLRRGGGASTFAVAVPDLAQAVAQLRAHGLTVGDPEPGQRQRPDGTLLRWRTAPVLAGPAWRPFLIEWGQSDADRLADLRARQIDGPHPLGPLAMDHLVIACADPATDAAWGAELVGATATREGSAWRVPLAGCDLLFVPAPEVGVTDPPLISRLALTGSAHQPVTIMGLAI
jgi:hypothetical protein